MFVVQVPSSVPRSWSRMLVGCSACLSEQSCIVPHVDDHLVASQARSSGYLIGVDARRCICTTQLNLVALRSKCVRHWAEGFLGRTRTRMPVWRDNHVCSSVM